MFVGRAPAGARLAAPDARVRARVPVRQAQADAVNLLAGAKTQANPESCVGVLTLAGKVPKMLVTPTPDLGKVLNAMQDVQPDGTVNLSTGVQARARARRTLPSGGAF